MKAMGLERRVAELETIVRAAFKVSPRIIACRVYDDAAQTLAVSATHYAIAFAHERWDTHELHDTSTNNSRIYAPAEGWYLIWGQVTFAVNATGRRVVSIRVDGTTYIAGQSTMAITDASTATKVSVSTMYYLTAGQYVELMALQASGGSLDTYIDANQAPEFAVVRLA